MIKMESSNDSCLSIVGMGYERKWVEIFLGSFFLGIIVFSLAFVIAKQGETYIWTHF